MVQNEITSRVGINFTYALDKLRGNWSKIQPRVQPQITYLSAVMNYELVWVRTLRPESPEPKLSGGDEIQ